MTTDSRSPKPPNNLLSEVYDALRELAAKRLASERPGHTLQATALVHDVYLKLAGESPDRWADKTHFFHAAAEVMRRVLIDHARARAQLKRGGSGQNRVHFSEALNVATLADSADPDDVLALDEAMARLEAINPEAGKVVRLRFYGGLTVDQTAEAAGISPRTVKRQWTFARAWLFRQLSSRDQPTESAE
jgi:RNA polymerase sigma factor (TIGR02999 family)